MNQLNPFQFESGGRKYQCRRILPDDKELFRKGFKELSQRSRYLRFFGHQTDITERQLEYFTQVDDNNHVAWGISEMPENESGVKPVGVARFVRDADDNEVAETAITVVDAYQQKGLGRVLYATINLAASRRGISRFRMYVLSENKFVLDRLRILGVYKQSSDHGIMVLEIKVYASHSEMPKDNALQGLVDTMKEVEQLTLRGPYPA